MLIIKGISYGAIAFLIFGLLFVLKKFPLSAHKAISLNTLKFLTIQNPWFWTVLVLTVITGCAYAKWLAV